MQSMQSTYIKESDLNTLRRLSFKHGVEMQDLIDIAIKGLIDGINHGCLEAMFELPNTQDAGSDQCPA